MFFELILNMEGCGYYGDIPQVSLPGTYEMYLFDWEDMELLLPDFAGPINDLCGTLFDLGDVDWFGPDNCRRLKPWIEARLTGEIPARMRELYEVLLGYVTRAIELDTGVVVDL